LSSEYSAGRRASYLNPIRMYVFTSAIFFLILFSARSSLKIVTVQFGPTKEVGTNKDGGKTGVAGVTGASGAIGAAGVSGGVGGTDTADVNVVIRNDSRWRPEDYSSPGAYDSAQNRLPAGKRDGWLKRRGMRRFVAANLEYKKDSRSYKERMVETFLHSFPKIMFFSLPFFALILRLLYLRRKQYFYVDHAIFTIHLYCATFILMLANILLSQLSDLATWGWVHGICNILLVALIVYMFIYLFMAMRTFYRQSWGKTLVKYVLLGSMALVVNAILLLLSLLMSVLVYSQNHLYE
jgi:hypothetical protein